jgi:hypothetical protein
MTERHGRPHTESELIELIHSSDVRAPEELHRRVQALVSERSSIPWHRRLRWGRAHGGGEDGRSSRAEDGRSSRAGRAPAAPAARGFAWRLGGAVALAALAGALVAGLTGTGTRALSVHQTAALTLRGATAAAPLESRNGTQLDAAVEGVAFPYWKDHFGWRSVGERTDRVAGRTITTVFYGDSGGRRIGYAIVSGAKAPRATGGTVTWRGGTPYRLLNENGVPTVVWLRDGHLCVLSGRGVDDATLLRLASWTDHGAVAS